MKCIVDRSRSRRCEPLTVLNQPDSLMSAGEGIDPLACRCVVRIGINWNLEIVVPPRQIVMEGPRRRSWRQCHHITWSCVREDISCGSAPIFLGSLIILPYVRQRKKHEPTQVHQ